MEELKIEDIEANYKKVFFDTNFLYLSSEFWNEVLGKVRGSQEHIFFSKVPANEIENLVKKYAKLEALLGEESEVNINMCSCINTEFDRYIEGRLAVTNAREDEYLFARLSFRPGEEMVKADVNCENLLQIRSSLINIKNAKESIIYEPNNPFLHIIGSYISALARVPLEFIIKAKDEFFTQGRAIDEELVQCVLSEVLTHKEKTCFISNDRYVQNLLLGSFSFLTKASPLFQHYSGIRKDELVLDIFEKKEEEGEIKLCLVNNGLLKRLEESPDKNVPFTSIANIVMETYKRMGKVTQSAPSSSQ